MKKIFALIFLFSANQNRPDAQSMAQDIDVFFNYAKEQLPKITDYISYIEKAKKTSSHDEVKIKQLNEVLKTYKICSAISDGDLKALESSSLEELEFKDGQIWVAAKYFQENMKGLLTSRILAGENALAFVILHSAMDKTEENKAKTISMLKILFNKKLNPNIKAGHVYWLKNDLKDTKSLDYVSSFSLSEAAIKFSFKEVQDLLQDYIKSFQKN